MRLSFLLALSCVLLGLAPAARAQTSAPVPLETIVGDSIPYRIGLPGDWEISRVSRTAPNNRKAHALVALGGGDHAATVIVAVSDFVKGRTDLPPGVSDARLRRMITDRILGSDSLMYGAMQESATIHLGKIQDPVREIRTFAGRRAAYMRGRFEHAGMSITFETHLTVRDGIAYVLYTMSDEYAAMEPLFARIRDSFVLAPAPR
jgi:hypothetical protein